MKIPISRNIFGPEELAAVQQPLLDGWVVQGKQALAFEAAFAAYSGARNALACSSGTAALQIAVSAMGLQPNDEVIVPGFTWIATANIVELCGATPVFCDIDLTTFNANRDCFAAAISSRTVGLIPVHLFGLCCDMSWVLRLAEQKALWIVEDAACALGSRYHGQHAGTIGDIGCFSFHPRKAITTGEGGMLTIKDDRKAAICNGLRNHGAVSNGPGCTGSFSQTAGSPSYTLPGFNYRLTDIQAALGFVQMQRLDYLLNERRRCAEFYADALHGLDWLRLPHHHEAFAHSWQSYVTLFATDEPSLTNVEVMHSQRNGLMLHLDSLGIATRQGTHAPPHLKFYAEKYGIRPQDFPNSWIADRLSLALPLFPGMEEAELSYVVDAIKTYDPRT